MRKKIEAFANVLHYLGIILLFISFIMLVLNIRDYNDQMETKIVQIEQLKSSIDQIHKWQIRHDEAEVYKMNYVKE